MRTPRSFVRLVAVVGLTVCGACASKDGGAGAGQSGGAGASTSGGSGGKVPGSGGDAQSNGSGGSQSGGAPAATGGSAATATGGSVGSGGETGTGGAPATGGSAGVGGAGGTTTGTGGRAASGGAAGSASVEASNSLGAIYSGVPLLDTSGKMVNAHGPGFIKVGSTYYMVGEQRSGANDTYTGATINAEDSFTGISMYSTTDFLNWTFVGTVVKPMSGTILAPPYYGERPKILYNASTSKYVIYIKMLNYVGNPAVYTGYYAVLTSSNIAGPYSYHGNLSMTGASDFQVFQDTDGAQYLAQSGGNLYKLSADGLSSNGTVSKSQSGEGVSLYKAGNSYFWQSSQGTYWYSNDNSYSTASSLSGSWTSHGYFCPSGSKTWQSQDTAVITVAGTAGTTYIYVGDRWVNGALPVSTLVMLPLTVSGTTESIPTYNPAWTLDVAAGTWAAVNPEGTSVNDNTTGTGPNQFTYTGTWTAGSTTGAFNGDIHSSSATGATATLSFTGTQILLYAAYNATSGIMGVTLGDAAGAPLKPELPVSLRYDAAPAANYLVYASPVLPRGSYQLKVRVTGMKDRYSSGTTCNVDRVLIVGGM